MNVLYPELNQDYHETTKIASQLLDTPYEGDVIFHCYWSGKLNKNLLLSLKSCYYFNIMGRRHRRIILWTEAPAHEKTNLYNSVLKYAEIRNYNDDELLGTPFEDMDVRIPGTKRYVKSDFVRLVLLYKYGGVWFDLDILFLRNFDPLFSKYEDKICLYAWQRLKFPNNAIIISVKSERRRLHDAIFYINERGKGFRFGQQLRYNLPLEFEVLPCSWFDPGWVSVDFKKEMGHKPFPILFKPTTETYTLDNFFKHAFCFHWHNGWHRKIQPNSALGQLSDELDQLIGSKLLPLK